MATIQEVRNMPTIDWSHKCFERWLSMPACQWCTIHSNTTIIPFHDQIL